MTNNNDTTPAAPDPIRNQLWVRQSTLIRINVLRASLQMTQDEAVVMLLNERERAQDKLRETREGGGV